MSVKYMGLGGREWADQGPGMSVKYTGLGGREWAEQGPRMSVSTGFILMCLHCKISYGWFIRTNMKVVSIVGSDVVCSMHVRSDMVGW